MHKAHNRDEPGQMSICSFLCEARTNLLGGGGGCVEERFLNRPLLGLCRHPTAVIPEVQALCCRQLIVRYFLLVPLVLTPVCGCDAGVPLCPDSLLSP